jgi:hypothetical protein
MNYVIYDCETGRVLEVGTGELDAQEGLRLYRALRWKVERADCTAADVRAFCAGRKLVVSVERIAA